MKKLKEAARKALATFLFASLGCIVGFDVLSVNVATWKVAASTGAGALINLIYRWSEAVVKADES